MFLELEVESSISNDNHEVCMARVSRIADNHDVYTANELLQGTYYEASAGCEKSFQIFLLGLHQKGNF